MANTESKQLRIFQIEESEVGPPPVKYLKKKIHSRLILLIISLPPLNITLCVITFHSNIPFP